jgi:hypothetical protein
MRLLPGDSGATRFSFPSGRRRGRVQGQCRHLSAHLGGQLGFARQSHLVATGEDSQIRYPLGSVFHPVELHGPIHYPPGSESLEVASDRSGKTRGNSSTSAGKRCQDAKTVFPSHVTWRMPARASPSTLAQ